MSTHPARRSLPAEKLRMVRRSDPENEILIFTSGQFPEKTGNKQRQDSAGCAVIYMPKSDDPATHPTCIGFRLEDRGPKDEFFNASSMRADLRAAVAALEFKHWKSEGWSKVTIASDSSYVVSSITDDIKAWQAEGWLGGRRHRGRKLKNMDLWQRLLDLVNEQALNGCEVAVWHITSEENQQARLVAEKMAREGERSDYYRAFGDVLSTS